MRTALVTDQHGAGAGLRPRLLRRATDGATPRNDGGVRDGLRLDPAFAGVRVAAGAGGGLAQPLLEAVEFLDQGRGDFAVELAEEVSDARGLGFPVGLV